MIAILLAAFGALLEETSNSIGKFAFSHRLEHPALMGLLNNSWAVVYFGLIVLFTPAAFTIPSNTVWILVLLIVLGCAQTIVTLLAIQHASRSSFGLLRTLTIPILALIDTFTGISIAPLKYVAMGVIFASIVWLHRNHGIERRGAGLVLFTAVNGAISLALLKHVLTLGVSVPASQLSILIPCVIMLLLWSRRGPRLRMEGKTKIVLAQTSTYGLAAIVESYALLLAPASIMTTALRSCAVLFCVVSGKTIFHERHLKEKIIASGFILIGLAMLAIPA